MGCNCGSVSNYTGNCGCSDPIELICTGPKGDTGSTGPAGTNGIAVLENILTSTKQVTVGVGSQVVYTYVLDNTPTPQLATNGSFLYIHMGVNIFPAALQKMYYVSLAVGARNLINRYPIAGPITALGAKYVLESESFLSRVTAASEAALTKGTLWVGSGILTGTAFLSSGIASALIDWTVDQNIVVTFDIEDTSGGAPYVPDVFTAATEMELPYFVIEKHVK